MEEWFTKECLEFWDFLSKNKGKEVEELKKAIDNGVYSKDIYLLERDKNYTSDEGEYFGFYLLDELAERNDYHELLTYILSIALTKPTQKQLERALQMAVVHNAPLNVCLLLDHGAIPVAQHYFATVETGYLKIFNMLLEKTDPSDLKKMKKEIFRLSNEYLHDELLNNPKKTKIIKEMIRRS